MNAFGLGEPTGVEIGEAAYDYPDGVPIISGPEYKSYSVNRWNNNPSAYELAWNDADTVTTAIGQSYNNYTSATMAKYIATLATRGTRYKLHLVDSVVDENDQVTTKYVPEIEQKITLKDSTWDAVYEGMYKVTNGSRGTARNVFGSNFSYYSVR